jgi:hypothetical protein
MAGQQDVRASDRDRDQAAAALGAHWTAGRLSEEELDRRVGAAYAATSRRELAELLGDLPGGLSPAAGPERRRRGVLLPGVRHFQERTDVAASREHAFDNALATMVPALSAVGYQLVGSERPALMRFGRRSGLLSFALRGERQLTVLFLRGETGGSRIIAFGEAPRNVRKAFAELRD